MLPDSKKTFGDLVTWFQGQEKIKALSYFIAIKAHLKLFNAALGNRLVTSLMPSDLENLQVRLKDDGYSPSYIDQVIDTARYMVTKALDNDLIGGDCLKPFRKIKGVLKRGANSRQRVLTPMEYRRLHDACPAHLRGIISLGFWTGMRLGEILPLTWNQIDLPGRMIRLKAEHTKEGMPKSVPLPKGVRDMLLTLPDRARSEAVFTYKGKPQRDIRDGLKRGCKAAKITFGREVKNGFVFHDLRHTFATNARRAGIPRNVIMAIMGHSTGGDMHARYDKVEDSDLLEAIDRMEEVFSANGDLNGDPRAKTKR
jgi:integrase